MAVFTSWAAVAFAFAPLASVTPSWQALSGVSPVKHDSKVAAGNCRTQMVFGSKARTAALCSLSALPVIAWALTGHWLLNNILGCCLCATIISFIRLPNMKICTILLGCLLLYDVFWVFFSSTLFGNNVMLHVAQQKSSNPVHAAAKAMNLPVASGIAPKLDPPVKLMFPASPLRSSTRASYSALGLGDVAIPGMVLALAACIDQKQSAAAPSSRPPRYLTAATAGPALLYLVPAVLLPVFAVAGGGASSTCSGAGRGSCATQTPPTEPRGEPLANSLRALSPTPSLRSAMQRPRMVSALPDSTGGPRPAIEID
eukprot:CAMPEP_0177624298 /NCGR_PEP_ID=MMETSP0419_2-20121207/29411_1 /TAXON_ID=582737 /ORGANISM="Tetraselmis sp., Strain GSL018" /LENGTH=313 /DNA_ID=CAMNT_0019125007 /DNA_START=344 /DNA_END=1283 /DNA_ORIENTATION=+